MKPEFFVHKLERHETKDTTDSHINGELTVTWRDWDKIINDPKMVYVNSINARVHISMKIELVIFTVLMEK